MQKTKCYILRLSVNGIKNIDKNIQLDFYNDTLDKNMKNISKSHIKAIYGPNGAGKTGIIQAMNIYTNALLKSNYLVVENANGNLGNLINQNTNKMTIEVIFCIITDNKLKNVYKHSIQFEKQNETINILHEELCKLSGCNINDQQKYSTIYLVKNGEVVYLNQIDKKNKEIIQSKSLNLLENHTLSSVIYSLVAKKELSTLDDKFITAIFDLFRLYIDTTVVLQDSDNNFINFDSVSQQLDAIKKLGEKLNEQDLFYNIVYENKVLKPQTDRVAKKYFENYQKNTKSLCKFLKVFKPDLKNIEIKKEDCANDYICEQILVYNDGKKISKKYESTGIKKLINIFSGLKNVENGSIVFIDELDANIHDVLLVKLIEYIAEYTDGQFVFTTHNIEPMEVLKNYKKSIAFLSNDSKITDWIKSGNYSPASLYKKGLIAGSPFNIEASDFMNVFGEDSDV